MMRARFAHIQPDSRLVQVRYTYHAVVMAVLILLLLFSTFSRSTAAALPSDGGQGAAGEDRCTTAAAVAQAAQRLVCGGTLTEEALLSVGLRLASANDAATALAALGLRNALDLRLLGGGQEAEEMMSELLAGRMTVGDRTKIRLLVAGPLRWAVQRGHFGVLVGASSVDAVRLRGNLTLGASTRPTAIKIDDAIEQGSSSRHRPLNPPAPLVCATQPSRFVAVSWNPTCECTGNEIVRRGGMPCEACYDFAKSKTNPTNYACRAYDNIVEFAELHGNIGKPGTCGPAGYEVACNAIDFGTHANVSVACAIDPKDPTCTRVTPLDLTNPVGTADQPFGEKYLLLNFVQIGQPIMTHPADTLPMVATNGTCSAADRFFSGIWWDNGIAAIAAQAELFFPAYKQAGGQLNELNADWEASMWAPGSCPVSDNATAAGLEAASACLACALLKWRAIEADPRFPAALKELQALGFTLDGTLADTMGVYQCIASNDTALRPGGMADCSQLDGLGDGQVNLIAWNALVKKRETDAWVSAMMPAATRQFPSVRLSLFSFYRWSPKFCVVPDVGEAGTPAILNCATGQGSSGPNVSAPVYYDYWLTFDCLHPHGAPGREDAPDRCAAAAGFSNTLQKLSRDPNFALNFTGMNIAKATVNHFRQIAQASNGTATELAPWLGFKSFFWDYGCPGYGQPHDFPSSPGCPEPDGYWNERVLHYGMTGAARFYYYNVFCECRQ